MNKLKGIMLVDDDEATNYLHKLIIERSGRAENTIICESGYDALEYLKKCDSDDQEVPELIFLDLNMPGMNGWEFLEEYHQLPAAKNRTLVVVMLTTSLNPDDRKKAEELGAVKGFRNKPLTVEMLNEIIDEYFAG